MSVADFFRWCVILVGILFLPESGWTQSAVYLSGRRTYAGLIWANVIEF